MLKVCLVLWYGCLHPVTRWMRKFISRYILRGCYLCERTNVWYSQDRVVEKTTCTIEWGKCSVRIPYSELIMRKRAKTEILAKHWRLLKAVVHCPIGMKVEKGMAMWTKNDGHFVMFTSELRRRPSRNTRKNEIFVLNFDVHNIYSKEDFILWKKSVKEPEWQIWNNVPG